MNPTKGFISLNKEIGTSTHWIIHDDFSLHIIAWLLIYFCLHPTNIKNRDPSLKKCPLRHDKSAMRGDSNRATMTILVLYHILSDAFESCGAKKEYIEPMEINKLTHMHASYIYIYLSIYLYKPCARRLPKSLHESLSGIFLYNYLHSHLTHLTQ